MAEEEAAAAPDMRAASPADSLGGTRRLSASTQGAPSPIPDQEPTVPIPGAEGGEEEDASGKPEESGAVEQAAAPAPEGGGADAADAAAGGGDMATPVVGVSVVQKAPSPVPPAPPLAPTAESSEPPRAYPLPPAEPPREPPRSAGEQARAALMSRGSASVVSLGAPSSSGLRSVSKVNAGMVSTLSVLTLELPPVGLIGGPKGPALPPRMRAAPAHPPPPPPGPGDPAGALLDGFLLLSAGAAELPEEASHVQVGGRGITHVEESDLHFFTELSFLDVSDNFIPDLGALAELPALRTLHMQCNALVHCTLSAGAFASLEVLDLSYNQVTGEALHALSRLPLLKELDVSCNQIYGFPAGLLDDLEAAGEAAASGRQGGGGSAGGAAGGGGGGGPGGAAAAEASSGGSSSGGAGEGGVDGGGGGEGAGAPPPPQHPFPSLTALDLSGNKLGGPLALRHLGPLPKLKSLRLAANGVTHVDQSVSGPGLYPALETLDLASNAIEYDEDLYPLASCPALLEVVVWGNPLAHRHRGVRSRAMLAPPQHAPPAGPSDPASLRPGGPGWQGPTVSYSKPLPPARPPVADLYKAAAAVDDDPNVAPGTSAMVFQPKAEIEAAFDRLDHMITDSLAKSRATGAQQLESILSGDMGGVDEDEDEEGDSSVFLTEARVEGKGKKKKKREGGGGVGGGASGSRGGGGSMGATTALARALGVDEAPHPPQFRDARAALNALKFALAHPLADDAQEAPRNHRKLTQSHKARLRETLPPPPPRGFEGEKEKQIESIEQVLANMRNRLKGVEKSLQVAAQKEGLSGAANMAEKQLV